MDTYCTEREKLRAFCSDPETFKAADAALFFSKVKAKLKELNLKVQQFTHYTQNSYYNCFDLNGSMPWQKNTKKYLQNLQMFDIWLEDVLYHYAQDSHYISSDCDTLISKWEIDLIKYNLNYTCLEFKMSQTITQSCIGYTVETEVNFKSPPDLISNSLFKTKAFISLFKYQNPQKAWAQIRPGLSQSLNGFKAEPVWYELQGEIHCLPQWDFSLQLPLRNIAEWLAERYEKLLEDKQPSIIFIFKN